VLFEGWEFGISTPKFRFQNQATIRSSGTNFSGTTGDVLVTVTSNGVTSQPFALTTRTPTLLLSQGTAEHSVSASNCFVGGNSTWFSELFYEILDNLADTVAGVGINEHFAGKTNTEANNWPTPDEMGLIPSDGTFRDAVCVLPISLTPIPIPPQTPLTGRVIDALSQEWRVGSSSTFAHIHQGVKVQTDDLTRFIDHARHLNIVQGP
jgi:hypothetical protein